MEKTLAHSAFYNGIYRALNVVFPLISAAYISRVLTPEGIGRVAYGQNIVSWFGMAAALGIPEYGTREIARCQGNADKLFSELALMGFLSTAVCTAAYYALALSQPQQDAVYMVLGLELLFQACSIDWFYQGKEEYRYIAGRNLITKLLSLALLVLLVRDPEDYVNYAMVLCLASGCNHIGNVLHARKYVRFTLRGLDIRKHLAPILTLMLSAVTASLYCRVDITMLGWLGEEAPVAFYTYAHKVVNIVLTLAAAVSTVFLPRLSQSYGKDKTRYRADITLGLKAVLLLAVPCCAGLMLVAEDLTVVLFGAQFAPAAVTIRILAVLILIKGVGDLLCYQALISAGKERQLIGARLLAGAANIGLNAVLIPRWGHNGAAVASVISELVVNGTLLITFLSITRPNISGRFWLRIVAAAAAMTAVVIAVQRITETPAVSLGISMAAGALAYFAVLFLKKERMLSVMHMRRKGEWLCVHGNK